MTTFVYTTMWETITINNEPFLISSGFKANKWKILLTNLKELWIEHLSCDEIIKKCQVLNPLLDIEHFDLNGIIAEIYGNVMKYIVNESINEIKLHKVIDGGIFKFIINLTKASPHEFWEVITSPLCLYLHEFQRQNNMLIEEIKRKDEEITEYKLNGAELVRQHIETKPFDGDILKQNRIKRKESNLLSIFQLAMNKNDDLILESFIENTNHDTEGNQSGKYDQQNSHKIETHKNGKKNTEVDNSAMERLVESDANKKQKNLSVNPDKSSSSTTLSKKVVDMRNQKPDSNAESKNKKRPKRDLKEFIS